MKRKKGISKEKSPIITEIGITSDTLSSRGGLNLFARYLRNIGIYPYLESLFGSIRKNKKGQLIPEIFKQLFCNLLDGTSRHLTYYDALKRDAGYAQTIESKEESLLSSHSVKRFYQSFSWVRIWLFRKLLQKLFIWRLHLKNPDRIELFLDTMVMDNDEAEKRHGVQPTYKKKKGFQPLQLIWGRYIIDAVFRGGKKHSNHGDTVEKMVRHIVKEIRKKYREDVPIIIKMDSGFFDQKLFAVFEELGIGYVCSGKTVVKSKIFCKFISIMFFFVFKLRLEGVYFLALLFIIYLLCHHVVSGRNLTFFFRAHIQITSPHPFFIGFYGKCCYKPYT